MDYENIRDLSQLITELEDMSFYLEEEVIKDKKATLQIKAQDVSVWGTITRQIGYKYNIDKGEFIKDMIKAVETYKQKVVEKFNKEIK